MHNWAPSACVRERCLGKDAEGESREIRKASYFHSSFYSVALGIQLCPLCNRELGERWVSVPWLFKAFDACSFLGKKAVGNVSHV